MNHEFIDIVFAKTTDPNPDFRFVEVEDASGASSEVGDWLLREDGYWVFRIEQVDSAQIIKALARAWDLGQTYWRQADSEYASDNRKSDETRNKYLSLVDEVSALLDPPPKDKP